MSNVSALVFGDVVGQSGCRALFFSLPKILKQYSADFVVVNGENASDGFGILPEMAQKFFDAGVDIITSGNHIWQKKEILPILESEKRLLRPLNYPKDVPGNGISIAENKGKKLGVMNLIGRERMGLNVECPFRSARKNIGSMRSETSNIIIDFHAESPSEKEALALYLDGKVSAVVGTHTHIQTADEKILPNGTAFITDLGMIGPKESVIGAKPEISIKRSCTQMPIKMEIADSDSMIDGIFIEMDGETGKAVKIERIHIH